MLIKNTTYECLVTKTVLNTKINEAENKIPNTSNLVTTTILNTKISEFKNNIPDGSKNILLLKNLIN